MSPQLYCDFCNVSLWTSSCELWNAATNQAEVKTQGTVTKTRLKTKNLSSLCNLFFHDFPLCDWECITAESNDCEKPKSSLLQSWTFCQKAQSSAKTLTAFVSQVSHSQIMQFSSKQPFNELKLNLSSPRMTELHLFRTPLESS